MCANYTIVELLEGLWGNNKAKGLLAQGVFFEELGKGTFGSDGSEKFLSGCWLLSPKQNDFYKFRYCFFIHPRLDRTETKEVEPKSVLEGKYRPFFAVAEFMNNAGIGIGYVMPSTHNGQIPFDDIKTRRFQKLTWKFFNFKRARISRSKYESD